MAIHFTTYEQACRRAYEKIRHEASGITTGVRCRFPSFNRAFGKALRPGNFWIISGLSGSGKSLILNLLRQDFTNPLINPVGEENGAAYDKIIILHFCFEMSPEDEVIRTLSYDMKKSYNWFLSSEWSKDKKEYNRLSANEVNHVGKFLKDASGKNINFVELACSVNDMEEYIRYFRENNPKAMLIATLDHTLLVSATEHGSDDEMKISGELGKAIMRWKKQYYCTFIALSQMNTKITDSLRREKESLHYPIRDDLYGNKQLGHAADLITFIHRPATIGIPLYGPHGLPTNNLTHVLWEKARNNNIGSSWLEFAPLGGGLIERSRDYFLDNQEISM